MKSTAELLKIEKALKHASDQRKYNRLAFYRPYPKQQQFHDLSLTLRERLLMASNQTGKTYCGAGETAYHLTGRYPDWWLGRKWERPVNCWVAGVTSESTRDNPQRLLCGRISDGWGTGMIPRDTVKWTGQRSDVTLARGVSDFFDTVLVDHVSGGKSQLQFKSYERGRQKWQGDTLDFIWFDEEPEEEIYSEGLTRTTATGGMTFITFTPLEGMTSVVLKFMQPESTDEGAQYRGLVNMTLDDAEHIPEGERAKIIAGWLPHEREARGKGIPMLGSGKVFQVTEESIKVDPVPIMPYWRHIWGLDFGQDHPFAAVAMAWDVDKDLIYVYHTIRMKNSLPLAHAAAMKAIKGGAMMPTAWPQDGHVRKEFEGALEPTAAIYRKHGIRMLSHHATFADGTNSTEAGILQMQERMSTNRFKVFSTCVDWWEEFRLYHRKDGKLVKLKDDLMSATRTGVMQIRSARAVLYDPVSGGELGRGREIAKGVDFDPWTGQ